MSDFKKSRQSADMKKLTQDTLFETGLDVLVEEIEQSEQEVDEQTQTLETKKQDIQGLEKELESISQKLGQLEGNALQVTRQEIIQKMEQKETEANECRNKLVEISETMQQKQSEISQELTKRHECLLELETAERECAVDLSESKESVANEKETLESANSKIEQVLEKINSALTDNQSEKKTEHLKSLMDQSQRWLGERFHEAVKTGKNLQTTLLMGTMLYGGMLAKGMEDFVEPIKEINNSIVAPLVSKDSGFSIIKDTEEGMQNKLGIDSEFQKLDDSRNEGETRERRKREMEIASEVRNQPGITGKK